MASGVRVRIKLDLEELQALEQFTRRASAPQGLVLRARIILACDGTRNNKAVAESLAISAQMVSRWTQRWDSGKDRGEPALARLLDLPRSGRPSTISPEQLCQLVALACDLPADYGRPITHWTQRELTEEAIKQGFFTHLSSRHMGRLLKKLELKPHKSQYWLNEKTDPQREEKIAKICQVYQEAAEKKNGRDYPQCR